MEFTAKRLRQEAGVELSEPLLKKTTLEMYSEKSLRMMKNMGFNPANGLGKDEQGRRDIIELSTQTSRRGLGIQLSELDAAASEFDLSKEHISLQECPEWLYNFSDRPTPLDSLTKEKLAEWVVTGAPKVSIVDETEFCDPDVLRRVLAQKSVFDALSPTELCSARSRSNVFETIGKSVFMNRAAVKMANMDAMLNSMFTNPLSENEAPVLLDDELLYFADVCAGPGGFSEYVLWRKNWQAKGFGFTLKCENDFKLHDFLAGSPEWFDTHYGAKGDGNVYDPENIESYTEHVLSNTDGLGVHFMMSDGGFGVEGQENIQEILSKQLYLCQCLVALSIVRGGGHFVTKLFDTFTPFSAGLVFLMSKCFKQISILKPNSSRPANSERYLVCKWKLANTDVVRDHLRAVNRFLWEEYKGKSATIEVLHLVAPDVLIADSEFYNYIRERNNTIGSNQVMGLQKIAAYCKNGNLRESKQAAAREKCLSLWRLPKQPWIRTVPQNMAIDQLFNHIMNEWYSQRDFMTAPERQLTDRNKIPAILDDFSSWFFMPIEVRENFGKNIRTFFMRGHSAVYQYNERKTWIQVCEWRLNFPRNTLVYGEIVKELRGEGKAQTCHYAFHIIDAIMLGGMSVRTLPLKKRLLMCKKFAKAVSQPDRTELTPIRCKELFPVDRIRDFFNGMASHTLKDGKMRPGLVTNSSTKPKTEQFYVPNGFLFLNELKPNLRKRIDKRSGRPYFVDLSQNNKCFLQEELANPDLIFASFKSSFVGRQLWKWDMMTQLTTNGTDKPATEVTRNDLESFIYKI